MLASWFISAFVLSVVLAIITGVILLICNIISLILDNKSIKQIKNDKLKDCNNEI